MACQPESRSVFEVDDRGRVSLARFEIKGTTVVVERLPGGGVVIQPAVVVTEAEAANYRNPHAVEVNVALPTSRPGGS